MDTLASHTKHAVRPVPVKARRRVIFNFHCRREAFTDSNAATITPLVVDPTGDDPAATAAAAAIVICIVVGSSSD